MILFPAILEWVQPGQFMFSWTVLFVALSCAAVGEVLEFVLGAGGRIRREDQNGLQHWQSVAASSVALSARHSLYRSLGA